MNCSRMITRLACRAVAVSVPKRSITFSRATYETTTIDTEKNNANTEKVEVFVTSETNKIGVVSQKEYIDEDGKVKRETIPPSRWDSDLASASEEIVKAERQKKPITMEALQKKSLRKLQQKDEKWKNVDTRKLDE